MFSKPIDCKSPIHPLLASRWSGVAYDGDRPIQQEDIVSLMEAARWSPSCFGDQPWRFLVFDRFQDPDSWALALACLVDKNQAWARQAPVLLITCHDTLFTHNDKPNPLASYDTGAAAMSLCVQASALGLMTHQMAGFSADQARQTFSIPERYKPVAMITVGYQVAPEQVPESVKEREFAGRSRKPLAHNFFMGSWDKGLE
jgi:nitroreductase